MKRASDRSRPMLSKASSISPLVLALRTWICRPSLRAAAPLVPVRQSAGRDEYAREVERWHAVPGRKGDDEITMDRGRDVGDQHQATAFAVLRLIIVSNLVAGCTKLDRIRPCANRPASHIASFTSLLRPGTFFTCVAFARMSAKRPSRMCQTGFQYTPVASIATCVHPALSSHSASANNPCVVVGKRRTSRSTFRLLIRRRQATTSALCTSRPAHLLCNVFIATSLRRGRHEALAL